MDVPRRQYVIQALVILVHKGVYIDAISHQATNQGGANEAIAPTDDHLLHAVVPWVRAAVSSRSAVVAHTVAKVRGLTMINLRKISPASPNSNRQSAACTHLAKNAAVGPTEDATK